MRNTKRVVASSALAIAALVMATMSTVPSSAEAVEVADSGGSQPSMERSLTKERTFIVSGDAPAELTEVSARLAVPTQHQPHVGEIVRVYYGDATVAYVGIAAACTESVTVAAPVKRGSEAEVSITFKRSGCSGSKLIYGVIENDTGLFGAWQPQGHWNGSMQSYANSVRATASKKCSGTTQRNYRGGGSFSSVGGWTMGPTARLNCG